MKHRKLILLLMLLCLITGMMLNSADVSAAEGTPEDRVWETTLTADPQIPHVEGTTGSWQDIEIDATEGKFKARENDTQISAPTSLSIPVAANTGGAELVIDLASGASVTVNDQSYDGSSQIRIQLAAADEEQRVSVVFTINTYITRITVDYVTPYPGAPGEVQAGDRTYTFENAEGLVDESGSSVTALEQKKGSFQDILVDATAGKFSVQPEQGRVQINAGTVLYVPVTTDEKGVSLLVSGAAGQGAVSFLINDAEAKIGSGFPVEIGQTEYVKVTFPVQVYLSAIKVDYQGDNGLETPTVEAKDAAWDLSACTLGLIQNAVGEYNGLVIDALSGKFSPREADTQITGGTIIYIPVAQDQEIVMNITGNNHGNLAVTLNGEAYTIGKEAILSVDEPKYLAVEFQGEGSCYLTGITVDYSSDNVSVKKTVTVGAGEGYDYASIKEALGSNDSSKAAPLTIKVAPGTYTEKLTVDKPYVTIMALDTTDNSAVIIRERYYSSNTFNEEGQFVPQDAYDVGTNDSGTILVTSGATGFTLANVTVENYYNTEYKTAKGEQTPAVALFTGADKVYINHCRILGRQDTLYVNGSGQRVYINNSYIEGTVDFIFGSADAYFNQCQIHMTYFEGRNTGYYTAPNTHAGDTGLVFSACTLTNDERITAPSLGRPWQNECYSVTKVNSAGENYATEIDYDRQREGYENISSAATLIGCSVTGDIIEGRFSRWTRKNEAGKTVSVTYDETVRFAEYNTTDLSGLLLSAEEYQTEASVASISVAEDPNAVLDKFLTGMRIGNGTGLWMPEYVDDPATEDPETPVNPPAGPETPVNPPAAPETPVNPPTAPETPVDTETGTSGGTSNSEGSTGSDAPVIEETTDKSQSSSGSHASSGNGNTSAETVQTNSAVTGSQTTSQTESTGLAAGNASDSESSVEAAFEEEADGQDKEEETVKEQETQVPLANTDLEESDEKSGNSVWLMVGVLLVFAAAGGAGFIMYRRRRAEGNIEE